MKKILLPLLFLLPLALYADTSSCITCHEGMEGNLLLPVTQWRESVHKQAGIMCVDCHGGNDRIEDEEAMSRKNGFKGVPSPLQIPKLCGGCHSNENFIKQFNPNLRIDQFSRYVTSKHGERWKKGDTHVATCVSCHGAHGIRKASDPLSTVYPTHVVDTCGKCHADKKLMQSYGIKGDEVDQYRKSVHARALYDRNDLSAPTCNDCHGNHGASPPGVSSIGFVCGNCHALNDEMFNKSPHKEPWEEMGIPQCEACHGKHAITKPGDAMLNPGGKAVCKQCHDEGDKGYITMDTIHQSILKTIKEIKKAEARTALADRKGMLMDDAHMLLQEAETDLVKGRAAVHTFDADAVNKVLKKSQESSVKALTMADNAMKELSFRHRGLLIFLVLSFILAFLLYLKIKQMEK